MRAGASDFVRQAASPPTACSPRSTASTGAGGPQGELRPLSEKIRAPLAFEEIVGSSPKFRTALAIAAKAARARVPVLIEGESGTGKEIIAHAIHAASPRARGALLTVDCGAIPGNLVESGLFGHERAPSPAPSTARSAAVEADGGTHLPRRGRALPLDTQVEAAARSWTPAKCSGSAADPPDRRRPHHRRPRRPLDK